MSVAAPIDAICPGRRARGKPHRSQRRGAEGGWGACKPLRACLSVRPTLATALLFLRHHTCRPTMRIYAHPQRLANAQKTRRAPLHTLVALRSAPAATSSPRPGPRAPIQRTAACVRWLHAGSLLPHRRTAALRRRPTSRGQGFSSLAEQNSRHFLGLF